MGFFETKKAAAILKHAVLDQYVDPFVGKTGLNSPGHRVAIIDGYAGEGRYDDGGEGSPALLMRKAGKLAPGRQLECILVEYDPDAFDKLQQVVSSEGQDLPVRLFYGDAGEYLPRLMRMVADIPVLVFLDPYGLMVPFEVAVKVFDRPSGVGVPATEMLINFNAGALRRIAGHLTSTKPVEATLVRMDEVCGGDWWRTTWLERADDREAAEDAVITEYARRIKERAKCGYWITDVRNRANLKPAYHLVFLSRHLDGLSVFGEALSLGLEKWRRTVYMVENEGSLFGSEEAFKDAETVLVEGWIQEIETNLRRLMAEGSSFRIFKRYAEVYGSAMGLAREKHLRAAWRRVHQDGLTKTDARGKLIQKVIEPA